MKLEIQIREFNNTEQLIRIAIAAKNESGISEEPVTPCGSCRQALIETEYRFNKPGCGTALNY